MKHEVIGMFNLIQKTIGMNYEMIETFNLIFNSCNPLNWKLSSRKNQFQIFNNSSEKTSYKWKNTPRKIRIEEYIYLELPSSKEHFYVFLSLSKIKL